jgi:hypothetical protein
MIGAIIRIVYFCFSDAVVRELQSIVGTETTMPWKPACATLAAANPTSSYRRCPEERYVFADIITRDRHQIKPCPRTSGAVLICAAVEQRPSNGRSTLRSIAASLGVPFHPSRRAPEETERPLGRGRWFSMPADQIERLDRAASSVRLTFPVRGHSQRRRWLLRIAPTK